ncbi:MAG: hypothetical protein ACRCU2_07370 [Planktothrix sp.]
MSNNNERLDKVKKMAKGAFLAGAEIKILKDANKKDKQREEQFAALENQSQKTALNTYKSLQVDKRLVKAMLIPRTGEVTSNIEFMFNPKEFNLMHKIQLENMNGSRTVRGLPKVNYGFVEPRTINLQGLIFDTYEQRISVLKKLQPLLDAFDFSKFFDPFKNQNGYQERLNKVSIANGALDSLSNDVGIKALDTQEYGSESLSQQALELKRPPVYYFIWGEKNYMCCMIENANFKLMMFLPDGTPVRASVDISLREVDLGVASRAYSKRQKFITAGQ